MACRCVPQASNVTGIPMAVKPLMTWNAPTTTWFKKYKKQRVAVSCRQLGTPKTKEGSTAVANEWFRQKRLEIDQRLAAPPQHPENITYHYKQAINNATFYAEWEEFNKHPEAAKVHRRHLDWLKKQGIFRPF